MTALYADLATSLLRGMTDDIAFGFQPISGQESLTGLIDRVQSISKRAQAQMQSALAAAFPDIGWIASEDKQDPTASDAPYWVYDPIDGAYHYLQGLPLWASSLALVKNGQPIFSLVYDPCLRELFAAEAGKGATLNGKPIEASMKTDLRAAVVGSALPPYAGITPEAHALAAEVLVETSKQVFVVRPMAAASLQIAYVAAGRLDAYIETGDDVYDWMAATLLVQEAGGQVSALNGERFDSRANGVLAAAPMLHGALSKHLSALA